MKLQFGNFTVDEGSRQVFRDSASIHLSPKGFDLLVLLIHERPRAVSKADLHARLWPKTFVSDASLAMLVAEIRAALGESARQPRCVRTVHRHGYAFQANAQELRDQPGVRPELDAPPSSSPDDAAPAYWLVTSSRQISLERGDNMVGRDPKARVWIDSPSVSRQHAVIRVNADGVILEDLGSKNGTHARDTRVTTATRLSDGDQLRFGTVGVSFRAWAADATRTEADTL